jgi:death-on-curing protein
MKIKFLSLPEITRLHIDQIKSFGGTSGIRDLNYLKSALHAPAATYDGQLLHPTIYEMASAYLFHIVKNHPFIDGNKRTGTMAMLVFLAINNYNFNAPNKDLLETVPQVAQGKVKKWTHKQSH